MSKGIIKAAVSPISLVIGDKATRSLLQVVGTVASFIPGGQIVAAAAFVASATVFKAKPKSAGVSTTSLDRLAASLNPSAPRTMVFGRTAMATDIRYVEPSGTNQEYIDYIIAVAAHKVTSIEEIWLEDALAWSSTAGVQGIYSSFLTVSTILEGGASAYHTVNDGTRWGAAQRLTGCASIHLRVKRSGTNSPFTGGLPGRMTVIGKGLPLYDPRRDSTVPGGSGTMRANDQSTWSYAPGGTEIGQNLALQALAYELGWKINGKLSVGCGLPPERLNLAGRITSANLCDETVTTSTGSQPRYHGAGVVSENDDPGQVMSTFATTANARYRESLGKLDFVVMHNDLALAAADPGLGDDEMIGGFTWNPDPSLEQTYNVVRGRYTNPSNASLYQLVDYPEVRLASTDGIDRVLPLDLPWVQDAAMAQRIAKQTLERKQYDRTLTGVFNMAGWAYKVGDIVPITLSALGMSRNPMRVEQQIAGFDGTCPMNLSQEDPAIYAWDADDRAAVTPAAPITYNPLNNPIIQLLLGAGAGQVTEGSSDYDPLNPTAAHWHSPPSEGDTYLRFSTDGGATFGDPVLIAGEGGPGQYQQFVFKRATSQPATPTGDGIPSGWSDGVPAGTDLIWMSVATQLDGITQGAWSTPAQISGQAGAAGPAGYSTATPTIYQRATSTPALPSVTTTYTFASKTLTGLNNGWSTTIPAGTDPLYASAATASSTGATDTIAASEWAAAQVLASNGSSGLSVAPVYIYQRATSTPSLPSVSTTYTFASATLTGLNNGWSTTIPAGTNPIYVSTATAASSGATDTITSGEWAAAQVLAQNGTNGTNGTNGSNGTNGVGTTALVVYGSGVTWDGVTVNAPNNAGSNWGLMGAYSQNTTPGSVSFSWQVFNPFGNPTDFFCGLTSLPNGSSVNYDRCDIGAIRFAAQSTGIGSSTSYHTECWIGGTGVAIDKPWFSGYTYSIRYDAPSGRVQFYQIAPSGVLTLLYSGTTGANRACGIQMMFGSRGQVAYPSFGPAGSDGNIGSNYPADTITGPGTFAYKYIVGLPAGANIPLTAQIPINPSSGSVRIQVQIQARISGSGSYSTIGSDDQTGSTTEPNVAVAQGTLTNATGSREIYEIQTVVTKLLTGTMGYTGSYQKAGL